MAPETQALPKHFDIAIIGGGINGAGVARDAAGRGYSVCLCDSGDFGGGTSSASTKLIHGGLRYLEHFEFRLVREALMEREVLWSIAPHIIHPMRFVLPYHRGMRPAWLLRLGLFLYDHLGGRRLLPGTRTLDLRYDEAGKPLKTNFTKAFEYSDCWVEDSRLVILNLRDATEHGADIRPHTEVSEARYEHGKWSLTLTGRTAQTCAITASVVVNATGPWVDRVLKKVFDRENAHHVRLVRGSHIVINRKFEHNRSYMFQNDDDRIIFAIPYEDDYTLIGTTDAEHGDAMTKPVITAAETQYLCEMTSQYFREPVCANDVVWSYSGVRPLFDDGTSKAQEATRDYVVRADETIGQGTLINIFGGKITTYRKLAESILEDIDGLLGRHGKSWTATSHLPGGGFETGGRAQLADTFLQHYPFIPTQLMRRLVRHYGTEVPVVLGAAKGLHDLGEDFGFGLYASEIRYLMQHEWALEADDVLFRRTKLGIRMSPAQISRVSHYMAT